MPGGASVDCNRLDDGAPSISASGIRNTVRFFQRNTPHNSRVTTMKSFTLIALLLVTSVIVTGCPQSESPTNTGTEKPCGTFDGKQLYKNGSSCYYYQGSEKVTVSSTACGCD
jgi:hypothetical protein